MELDFDKELAKAARLANHEFATDTSKVLFESLSRLKRLRELWQEKVVLDHALTQSLEELLRVADIRETEICNLLNLEKHP